VPASTLVPAATVAPVTTAQPAATATGVPVPTLTLTTQSGLAGATITANGSGFKPTELVDVSFNGATVGSPTVNSGGTFSLAFTIPDLTPGPSAGQRRSEWIDRVGGVHHQPGRRRADLFGTPGGAWHVADGDRYLVSAR
jgi:hypothetical protein